MPRVKPGEDAIRTVTVETERGTRIIFDYRWKAVTILGPTPSACAFNLSPEDAVKAIRMAKEMRGDK